MNDRDKDFDEDGSSYDYGSVSVRSDTDPDLTPAQKIDLWKKLQDLMRNQLREER